jgi:hypothetical protein
MAQYRDIPTIQQDGAIIAMLYSELKTKCNRCHYEESFR